MWQECNLNSVPVYILTQAKFSGQNVRKKNYVSIVIRGEDKDIVNNIWLLNVVKFEVADKF